MPRSLGKHVVVEHEDEGLIRPKSGTRVPVAGSLSVLVLPDTSLTNREISVGRNTPSSKDQPHTRPNSSGDAPK